MEKVVSLYGLGDNDRKKVCVCSGQATIIGLTS
jgi:hypothetical protein